MTLGGAHGLFALGVPQSEYSLPHQRINKRVMLLLHQVLARAFEILRSRFSLKDKDEDSITLSLVGVLENDLRKSGQVKGFDRQSFGEVSRHRQVENFNFEHPKKAPDVVIRFRDDEIPSTALSTHYAIFVECKPVDVEHTAGSKYCDEGMQRFVEGEYAWAMQDALMIGYARDGRTLQRNLLPALQRLDEGGVKRLDKLKTRETLNEVGSSFSDAHTEPMYRSRHGRGFQWPDGKGSAVDIFLYHSWHCCD